MWDSHSKRRTTGELREIHDEILNVEWKIDGFLSLPGDEDSFNSRSFSFSHSSWYLTVFPYGEKKDASSNWISLYLRTSEVSKSQIVTFQMGIKKPDGDLCLQQTFTWNFKAISEYRFPNILARSELKQRKEELLSSGALTIACTMKKLPSHRELSPFPTGLEQVFLSTKHSDVTIHVGEQAFEVHKNILAASSVVFDAMFEHEMSEKNSSVVNVSDCDSESFADFLRFMYTGRAHITDLNVLQLYKMADKYNVGELKSNCVAFMMQNLSIDNVCDVLAFADQYSDIDLNCLCVNFFEGNVKNILLTSNWKSLLKHNYLLAYKLLKNIASRIEITK